MASLEATYPPRSAMLPLPKLKPNELRIGGSTVNILVVTAKGCGTRELSKYGCGSILRLDRAKRRAWLCEEGSPGVCIGLNHGGVFSAKRHRGQVCSLQEGRLGKCEDHARQSLGPAKMGPKLVEAVQDVDNKFYDTMYWKEHVGEGRGEFTSFAPDSNVFSTVKYSGATTLKELDDLQVAAEDRVYSETLPTVLTHDEGTPSSDSPPDYYAGGRKRRGRKRRTRRTRGRRRRSTHKRKRRVRRRGTRRR